MHRHLSMGLAVCASLLVVGLPISALGQFSGGQGLPGRREGAGTRGTCLINQVAGTENSTVDSSKLSLISVIPESNLGLTLSEYPTFFWYIPNNATQMAEFSLTDVSGSRPKKLYEKKVDLRQASGVIHLQLPPDAPALAVGKTYSWTFRMICVNPKDPADRSGDIYVRGYVQRVEPNPGLSAKVNTAKPRDLPGIYATAGLWHETLSSLTSLMMANPNDESLRADWQSLMKGIKLDQQANAALTSCCQIGQSTSQRESF